MFRKSAIFLVTFGGITTIVLAGALSAQAAPGDLATPAGTGVGSVVIFGPAPGSVPGTVSPQGLILLPVPATGSLVFPVRVPPVSGTGPSSSPYVLVIPGPNPAQNTGVALGLQLSVSIGAGGVVTVYPIPAP